MTKKILSIFLSAALVCGAFLLGNNANAADALTATKTTATIGAADGVKDEAYAEANAITINHVAWVNDNATPATATMYLLWDASYIYVFVEVIDDTYYAYQEGTWLEHRDALEMLVDLKHDTSYTGGYGGDYRGDKMCEGFYKIAAGVGTATVDKSVQGTHWMWDDQKNNGSYASALTETGYTVEYKISVGKDAAEFMVADREIGMGVKIYDKHADNKNGSITVMEAKNDGQSSSPCNLSTITLVDSTTLATAKETALAELASYKSAELYREAEQALLATAINDGTNAINEAKTIKLVNSALYNAKAIINTIKTDELYTIEEDVALNGRRATKTSATIGAADGVKDSAYDNTYAIPINYVKHLNENATPATALMYLLWDESYIYVFVEVIDDTHYGYQEGTWLEHRDALEMIVDLKHDTSYTGGYGGDYRGDKMCEGFYKIAAGVGTATVDKSVQGTHWMWDAHKASGSYASKLTDTGYTVEYKIYAGDHASEFMVADREIGMGVKLYDKHVDDKSSVTLIEDKNDAQANGPQYLSTIKLVDPVGLAEAKETAIDELSSYKSADLYREAEQALLATAIEEGNNAINAANTFAGVETALATAKSAIDAIKTKATYEAEELAEAKVAAIAAVVEAIGSYEIDKTTYETAINAATTIEEVETALANAKTDIETKIAEIEAAAAEALANAKTTAKTELASYKSADLYRENEKALLATAITEGNTAIDAATTIEAVETALAAAKTVIDKIPTDEYYLELEAQGLANTKTAEKAKLASYKSADLYREAEQAILSNILSTANAAIDAATTIEEVIEIVNDTKVEMDAIKTKAAYEAEELAEAKEEAIAAVIEAIGSYEIDKTTYETSINEATTIEEVETALTEATTEITAKIAEIEAAAAAAALATAKETALAAVVEAIGSYEIDKTTYETSINEATTIEEVETALTEAITDIAAKIVEIEAAAAALLLEKNNAKAELEDYKSAELYREAEQALLATAIANGKTAIDSAENSAAIEQALANAKNVINNIKTKVQYEIEEEMAEKGITATKTTATIGAADGVKDAAYAEAQTILINNVAWKNENATPATAMMYLLWDDSYIYVFVEVIDDTHYGYQEGTWLEHRDALEMIIDLKHDTSYTGGYGEDYRGDKMCEGYYKIAAGVGTATVGSTVQGTHWMWDDQKNNGSYASALTETGYTVEYKISVGKDAAEFMVADREIGIGVKLYDKHADNKDGSITVIEAKNDGQHEKPMNLSTIRLVDPLALGTVKENAKAELASYKSADLYREAEKALLAAAIEDGKAAIDEAITTEAVEAALANAKAVIDAIKTDEDYKEAEGSSIENVKASSKEELASYKSADLYREAEKVSLAKILSTANTAIDAATTVEEIFNIVTEAKQSINNLKTNADYELEAFTNAKTNALEEVENYKSASLYREAEQALLATAIANGKAAINEATTIVDVESALAAAKTAIDAIKTKAAYEAEEAAAQEQLAKALLEAKNAAKSEIESYKSLDGLSDEQIDKVNEEIEMCKKAIENAKSIEDINEALRISKIVLDGIVPQVKKGCKGSITATLFGAIALAACAVFLRKRNNEE